ANVLLMKQCQYGMYTKRTKECSECVLYRTSSLSYLQNEFSTERRPDREQKRPMPRARVSVKEHEPSRTVHALQHALQERTGAPNYSYYIRAYDVLSYRMRSLSLEQLHQRLRPRPCMY
ncbi:MAG: hypothetical protein ACK55Z_32630, partial [bacterium]